MVYRWYIIDLLDKLYRLSFSAPSPASCGTVRFKVRCEDWRIIPTPSLGQREKRESAWTARTKGGKRAFQAYKNLKVSYYEVLWIWIKEGNKGTK